MRSSLSLLCLFAFSTGFAVAADAPRQPGILADLPFPASVAGANWGQITNYAQNGSAGGVGVSYRSTRIKTDIYVYEAGDDSLRDRPLAERLRKEIDNVAELMKEMERRGHYRDIVISPEEEVAVGAKKFTCIKIAYTEKDTAKHSRYYLSSYGDRLLKIRITGETSLGDDPLDLTFVEAATPFE